ncbi:hypothetical protein B0T09DRAFT_256439 [Sordaria sp. MPI-SDFR-AT-0083]|nr:hypothetical protein B0T09DRAFT_256439 [Sordaria sp. MPI-SDFR-AT-0083]
MYYIRDVVRRIIGDGESRNKGDEQVADPAPQSLWSLVGSGRGRMIARWELFECKVE